MEESNFTNFPLSTMNLKVRKVALKDQFLNLNNKSLFKNRILTRFLVTNEEIENKKSSLEKKDYIYLIK